MLVKLNASLLCSSLIGSALLLSGCQLPNPYTGEAENTKATNGAMIGALSGAVIGVLSS
jgi:hypothetical protein